MNSPSIELRAKQSLTLTPRMQQSVRLLQLSALEFTQEVNDALANNPFLESDEPGSGNEADTGERQRAATSSDTPEVSEAAEYVSAASYNVDSIDNMDHFDGAAFSGDAASAAISDANDAMRDGHVSNTVESGPESALNPDGIGGVAEMRDLGLSEGSTEGAGDGADPYSSRQYAGDGFDPGEWMHSAPSLREKLHQSLRLTPLDSRDRLAALIIIESLEADGYLRMPFDELADISDCDPPLTHDELENAVRLVQTLDKPGIAARSLSECLQLQLQAMPESRARNLAIELAGAHLGRLAKREHAELQKRLGCDADTLRAVTALIRRLDPKPGESAAVDEHQYLIPDVIVRQIKGRWTVAINPAVMPRARVHRMYADMFAQSEGSSRSPLAQQLQEARWLLRNVQQRFSTIQRVAEVIVSHQRAFFDYGEIALKPLVLRDVADELSLHESTVSRATGNKYMATPRGIFEFKHFFPRELGTESGGTCSAAAVRALLKEMISGENTEAPLSDVTLAKLLAQQGVIVARRTVAKYRRLMKVPPAELRRAAI
ncbi:RNA polymerase factor sigma-54 [Robbsia sp. KACC 23696]|uniref:RNA polymerase factor sigma-54 n=1 Tax=Robbsia sp. KACC 23696 TaxID=3149231 RepID=UPI00325A6567